MTVHIRARSAGPAAPSTDATRRALGPVARIPSRSPGLRTATLLGVTILLAFLLALALPSWTIPVRANTGCPGSTNSFGSQSLSGDCTITANTSWGNGTLTLAGNLAVNGGSRLTLWNMAVRLNPSADQQYRVYLPGGQLVVRGGTLTSTNPGYGWRLETDTGSAALLDVDRTNVSYAGSGSYSGFLFQGGNGYRLRHLTVTQSSLGSGNGVIDVNGGSIRDLRVENSTFTNTGTAYYVESAASGANLVFWGNTISGFAATNGGPGVMAEGTQVMGNTINVGSATAVQVWGGGPGWPSKNAYNVSRNTITTTGDAIGTSGSAGYDITWNTVKGGHVSLDGNGNRFAYNNITGTDARSSPGHILWTSPNSSIDHNTFWNVDLTTDSGILTYLSWGNVHITDNRMFLSCYGNNCMAVETINVQAAQRPIFPGFPTVEIARNRIDWVAIGSGGWAIGLDNEFSEREWLHDNTFLSTDPGGAPAGNALQGGGVENSVYENNTDYGPTVFCIYEYIYQAAGNLFQNNTCNHPEIGGIFQTGGNVYRNNVFNDVQQTGLYLCTPGPCAGSTTNTINNAWYNNTFRLAAGANLVQMSLSNALSNNLIAHGGTTWSDGSTSHPIYGDWLYWANTGISHLAFSDASNGHRTLSMTVNGQTYWDTEPVSGVTDSASIAVDGAIDYHGSLDGESVLGSLSDSGTTALTVTGTGTMTFTLAGFWSSTQYNVAAQNVGTGTITNLICSLDSTGWGQFTVPFGLTSAQFSISLSPAGGSPPPSVPPSVTTSPASSLGTTSATLNGDLASLGSATSVSVGFLWGTSSTLSGATNVSAGSQTAAGAFTASLTGLTPATTYYFQAWAKGAGFAHGSIVSFATSASSSAPSVTTGAATGITTTGATLNADLAALGGSASVSVGFLLDTSPTMSAPTNITAGTLSAPGAFSAAVSSLAPGTIYYAAAWAAGAGFATGSAVSFTTSALAPAVTTDSASAVNATSSILNGTLGDLGSASSVTVGFWYGTSSSLGSAANVTAGTFSAPCPFALPLTGLASGTTYYFRAWALGMGFVQGAVLSFATAAAPPLPQGAPAVVTYASGRVAATWAILQGGLTSLGGLSSVVVGFRYGTSPSLSGAMNLTLGTVTTAQTFRAVLAGLAAKTTYYYAAWAQGQNFSQGNIVSFTTTAWWRFPPHTGLLPWGSGTLVLSARYDPSAQQLDVVFSTPMNRTSVVRALSFGPGVSYQIAWADDAHLRLHLTSLPPGGAEYSLSIASSAASLSGRSMRGPFMFAFTVPSQYGWPSLWPALAGAATAALVSGLIVRRGLRRLESLSRLAASARSPTSRTPLRPMPRPAPAVRGVTPRRRVR